MVYELTIVTTLIMSHCDEELIVHPFSTLLTEIHDLPIPSGPDELVIRALRP